MILKLKIQKLKTCNNIIIINILQILQIKYLWCTYNIIKYKGKCKIFSNHQKKFD